MSATTLALASIDYVKAWLEERPNEPYFWVGSGNRVVIGLRATDGITVFDALILDQSVTFKRSKMPTGHGRAGRRSARKARR